MELRFLLYDEGRVNDGFFIKCKRIGISFEKNPIENKLFFRLLKDELKKGKSAMKYFTNNWHRTGSQYTNEFKEKVKEYNEFVKSNYEFYPKWYKIQSLAFHDAFIEKFYCKGNDY